MPDFCLENEVSSMGFSTICGIDEAGRGSWAGPVVSAAVVLNTANFPPALLNRIKDSKTINKRRRESVFESIKVHTVFGLGVSNAHEIDKLNILYATMLSMRRAVSKLIKKVDFVLIDGNKDPKIPGIPGKCIVKGDAKSFTVATASIIAKVMRDKMMADLGKKYPGYGWAHNAGYGTKEHKEAISILGVTPEHRKSFKPVRNMLLD